MPKSENAMYRRVSGVPSPVMCNVSSVDLSSHVASVDVPLSLFLGALGTVERKYEIALFAPKI